MATKDYALRKYATRKCLRIGNRTRMALQVPGRSTRERQRLASQYDRPCANLELGNIDKLVDPFEHPDGELPEKTTPAHCII